MIPKTAMDQLMTEMNVLPKQLKRNLNLLKTLNKTVSKMSIKMDKYADCCLTTSRMERKKKKASAKINRLIAKMNDIDDDKVLLAAQTYELVDKYIQRLDSSLVSLESARQEKIHVNKSRKELIRAIVRNKKKSMANGAKSTDVDHISIALANTFLNDDRPIAMNTLNLPYHVIVKVESENSSHVLDMPVDPNEPRFCICQQVSFGQMIGCDNIDCPTEWFHFSCVNLTQSPKGKWFCKECKTKKNKFTKYV